MQPPRTSCTTASICGAGAPPKLRDQTGRAWRCQLWFWLSFNGPAPTSPTWPSTPVQVVGVMCLFGSRMDGRRLLLSSWPGSVVSLCAVCCLLPPGRGYIVCGDDKGRLWTYHVTDLQKSNFQAGKPIQPTEVFIFSSCVNLHTEPPKCVCVCWVGEIWTRQKTSLLVLTSSEVF